MWKIYSKKSFGTKATNNKTHRIFIVDGLFFTAIFYFTSYISLFTFH